MEGSFRKQKVSDDRQLEGIKEEIRRLKEEMNQEEAKKAVQQDGSKKVMQQDETIKTEIIQESENRKEREDGEGKQNQ